MTDQPKIEKGIPIPPRGDLKGRGRKSVFWDMEIGDSAFFPGKAHDGVSNAYSYVRKRTGAKFEARTVTENGVKGIRVWRTK